MEDVIKLLPFGPKLFPPSGSVCVCQDRHILILSIAGSIDRLVVRGDFCIAKVREFGLSRLLLVSHGNESHESYEGTHKGTRPHAG